MKKVTPERADLEAQAEQRRKELVEALLALCALLIRRGADPAWVQEFANGELDRMATIIARRRLALLHVKENFLMNRIASAGSNDGPAPRGLAQGRKNQLSRL